jgi:hypothetical protein
VSDNERRTYFHSSPVEEDPKDLLVPENQVSTPWGDADCGPCDKCRGTGTVDYRCNSCLETGSDPACPACRGRVRFSGTCPTCEGDGEIDRVERRGVSVFPSAAGLRRYLEDRDVDLEEYRFVELKGERSDDVDLDADAGALLVFPSRIVRVGPPGPA